MDEERHNKIPELEDILSQIEKLLRRVQAYPYANTLERIIHNLNVDPDSVMPVLVSNEFWGGAGSFIDLQIVAENHHVSDDFARDNREYICLLLQLLRKLHEIGHTPPGYKSNERLLSKLCAGKASGGLFTCITAIPLLVISLVYVLKIYIVELTKLIPRKSKNG